MSIPEDILTAVSVGRCPFRKLPPLMKKVVRIFISSTFSDTKEERNALMKNVYPRLAEFCREKYGLEFQVVDMRWGVPEQASDNHSTTELCLQEIRKCQEVSVGPNFVAILGDKYGYRPIPSSIDERQFSALASAAVLVGQRSLDNNPPFSWSLVQNWFLKDENATPAVYVLQPISSKLPHYNDSKNLELRKEAYNEWNTINSTLCSTLRTAAEKALEGGQLSDEEKQAFFTSVTESEVTEGALRGRTNLTDTCLCIIRKIPDIEQYLQEPKAPKFIDVQEAEPCLDQEAQSLLHYLRDDRVSRELPRSNLTMIDIDWEASGAKISLETVEDLNVAKYAERFAGQKLYVNKHKEYLDDICADFFQKITKMISHGGMKQKETYDEVTTEVLQHLHFAKLRCEVFEGRQDVIDEVHTYLKSDCNIPLAIYGNSGCGKTSIMSKILGNMEEWSGPAGSLGNCVVIVRFLGTTALTSNLHQLLVSMCKQLCKVYQHAWEDPDKFSDLVSQFYELCGMATKEKPLIIMLDSIDQLMPAYNAYKLAWLPSSLPQNVKMIVSAIDEGYDIVVALHEKYAENGGTLLQVMQLGENVGFQIVQKWLHGVNRDMNKQQEGILKGALQKCSLPLYARIAFDQIRRWRSYEQVSVDKLQTTIKGAINKLFQQMEQKFGEALVKHCLAYLTASRYGLSEVELEHILSLDDELLNKVYQFWKPPVRRIPPLLWTRVRSEINSYIVERSADDMLVLAWYHRQFIETTRIRYLSDNDFARQIHCTMAEFFQGKWGGWKEKPFKYSENQKKRFRLETRTSQEDRKVPEQPLIFETESGGGREMRFNKRKLTELPHQLHKSKQLALFKAETFFNLQWLYAKLRSGSLQSILEEFEIFMQADRALRTDAHVRSLYATLKLIRPYVSKYPDSLPLELAGRLSHFVGKSADMTALIRQCDTFGSKLCPLTPLLTCFDTADLGLNQILNIRPTEPWSKMGTMSFSKDFKTMYIIDYDEHGEVYLASWDVESGERIQQMPIKKKREEYLTDLYFQSFIDSSSTHMIALYRHKFTKTYGATGSDETQKGQYRDKGCIDVIRVEDGVVIRTFIAPLDKREFFCPVIFLTTNWIAARFGWKLPMINIYKDIKHGSSKPHLLLPDERTHVVIRGKKSKIREYVTVTEEDSNKVVSIRSTSVHLETFPHQEDDLGELETSENTDAIACTSDCMRIILATGEYGTLHIYKLKKTQGPGMGKGKRPPVVIKLAHNEKIKLTQKKTEESSEVEGRQSIRVTLFVSPNDEYVIGCYQDKHRWEAFLWYIPWAGPNCRFVGRITEDQPLVGRYPAFSADSQYIVFACANNRRRVYVMTTSNTVIVNQYEMTGNVRDIAVSKTTNQCAVLLGKDVVFMDITERSKPSDVSQKKVDSGRLQDVTLKQCLIRRENYFNGKTPEKIEMAQAGNQVSVREVQPLFGTGSERNTTAQTQAPLALDTLVTPDGTNLIQLHRQLQVIDSAQEEIRYTPKEGDVLVRTTEAANGQITTENIPIVVSDVSSMAPIQLQSGNRIVNASNKTKYRVPPEKDKTVHLVTVPSCVRILRQQDNREVNSKFYIYQERLLTASNDQILTCKKTKTGDFINLYDLQTGQLQTTHPVESNFALARMTADGRKLYTITSALQLKVYEENGLVARGLKIDIQAGGSTRYNVKDIILFPGNRRCLLVQYSPEGIDGFGMSIYILVNTETKETSLPMTMRPAFEDISSCGMYAIDSRLTMYDLSSGSIARQIPYQNANVNMQLQVRISDDAKYVVFIDKQDDTLHLVKLVGKSAKLITSCFTHASNLSAIDGFSLRQSGSILSIKGPKLALLLLRESETLKLFKNIDYTSESHRALSLIEISPSVNK